MPKRSKAERKTNVWTARVIPLLMFGLAGYTSWVLTRLICIDYLIKPSAARSVPPRVGSAIAILVVHYILLFFFTITYGRLLYAVTFNPGYTPYGPHWYRQKAQKRERRSKHGSQSSNLEDKMYEYKPQALEEANETVPMDVEKSASSRSGLKVEDFWKRDVFTCQPDGRPTFCTTCCNWKPDRAHHSSEVNRCVMKMDHFCPWVGGVVGDTSYKFFVQFTFYATLIILELLVVTSYFFAERRRMARGFSNGYWISTLAASSLFFLFSGGMFASSAQFAFVNLTTIEHRQKGEKVWFLAVYANEAVQEEAARRGITLSIISYPRPREETESVVWQTGPGVSVPTTSEPQPGQRDFAILQAPPGTNPWDIGPLGNFQQVMGYTLWEWLLPIHSSPCLRYDDSISLYKMGNGLLDTMKETGLSSWKLGETYGPKRRRSRRSRPKRSTRRSFDKTRGDSLK